MEVSSHDRPIVGRGFDFQLLNYAHLHKVKVIKGYILQIESRGMIKDTCGGSSQLV